MKSSRTLRLKRPFGTTFVLSIAILACLVIAGELLLRWGAVQSRLPFPSYGNHNRSLDVKLHLLERMVRREGPPDCLFLGSSLVNTDIDPEAFTEAYRKTTGKSVRCFNFGINAMSPHPGAKIARILNRLYRPKMVVWGITPNDLNPRRKKRQLAIEDGNWVRYQLGEINFNGWLIDRSYLFRYYLRFRFWMDYPEINKIHRENEAQSTMYGFRPDRAVNMASNGEWAEMDASFRKISGHWKTDRRILPMLHQSFLANPGIALVLAEMPVHRSCYRYYQQGEKTHWRILSEIEQFTRQHHIHFIPAVLHKPLADEEWLNPTHLNNNGARQFSRWLGKRVGSAVRKGWIPDPCRGKK